jgi:LCP family protein required for cell wall assembly
MKKQKDFQFWERSMRRIKWVVGLVVIGVIGIMSYLVIAQMVFVSEVSKDLSNSQDYANNLITELGEVREENLILKSRLEYLEKYVMKIAGTVRGEYTDDYLDQSFDMNLEVGSDLDALPDEIIFPDYLVNILLLGENEQLTDTIIVASINPKTENITFISIPRDLSVSGRKINALYKQYGPTNIMDELEEVTGLSISHYAVINMQAFIDIIDIVGGVTINNEEDIVDYYYPTSNKGYTLYELSAGIHELDGEEALKFARSRKSTSDFDRAKRQQIIIRAVKDKVETLGITDLNQLRQIYTVLIDNIDTDISFFQGVTLYNDYRGYSNSTGHVIDTTEFLFGTRNFSGQFILLPYDTTWSNVQKYIYNLVTS